MTAQSEFRAALENGDIALLRKASAVLFPHIAQPETDEEALITMHMARTQADWLPDQKRRYSHAWLTERGLPSQLPDILKPKAEQVQPVVVEAVLVAVDSMVPELQPLAKQLQQAMSDAVEGAYAEGRTDPEFVRARMAEARSRRTRELLGTTGGIPHG